MLRSASAPCLITNQSGKKIVRLVSSDSFYPTTHRDYSLHTAYNNIINRRQLEDDGSSLDSLILKLLSTIASTGNTGLDRCGTHRSLLGSPSRDIPTNTDARGDPGSRPICRAIAYKWLCDGDMGEGRPEIYVRSKSPRTGLRKVYFAWESKLRRLGRVQPRPWSTLRRRLG